MRTRRSASEALVPLAVEKKKKLAVTPKITTLHNFQDQSNSTFLGLPPDLRNIIYELCLPGTCEVPNASVNNRNGGYQPPALLISCKQAYAEGINIFYQETAFIFSGGTSRLSTWLSHVASRIGHGAMLKSITLMVEPMKGPDSKIVGKRFSRYSRDPGVKFVDLVSARAKRAKIADGVLKLEFRTTDPYPWYLWMRGDARFAYRIGALQTWALSWDDSGKAKMVQC